MIENKNVKSCSVVLAGGSSSRMGTNKSLLPLQNKLVIEHIIEELQHLSGYTVINANNPELYHFLGLPVVQDRFPGEGPLAGLEAALSQLDADVFFVSACDTPFISKQIYCYLYNQLKDFDAIVPIFEGKMHPLSGIYKKSVHSKIRHQLEIGQRKIRLLFDHINVKYVDQFDGISNEVLEKHFFNMNDQSQYRQAKHI